MSTDNNSGYHFGLFFVPLGIAMVLATVMMGHAMYIIWQVTDHSSNSADKKTNVYSVCNLSVGLTRGCKRGLESGFIVEFSRFISD
jgi:hypothetical protein